MNEEKQKRKVQKRKLYAQRIFSKIKKFIQMGGSIFYFKPMKRFGFYCGHWECRNCPLYDLLPTHKNMAILQTHCFIYYDRNKAVILPFLFRYILYTGMRLNRVDKDEVNIS